MKLPDLITLIAPTQICNQILGKSFERVECCYFSPVKAPSVENESCSPRILFHLSVLPTLVHPLLHSNFKILPSRNHNPLASYISLFSSRKEYLEVDTFTSSKFVIDLGHVAKVFQTRLAPRIRGISRRGVRNARDLRVLLLFPWNI